MTAIPLLRRGRWRSRAARIRSASYCIVRSRVSATSDPALGFLVTFSAPVIV